MICRNDPPFVVIQRDCTNDFSVVPEVDVDMGEVILTNRTWSFELACEAAEALRIAVLYKGLNFLKGPLTLRL